jgi:hypothetical protein
MSRSSSTGHTLIDEEKKETLKKQPGMGWNHALNMELDLQSLFGLLCTALFPLAETPELPAFGLIFEGAIGQPR